ncbi:Pectate lyase [Candidatus Sulfotelmatomonas gaucii]|uniref:Pectate lyase n=1 Tax=Candidatus Sulfuritelmatomonas gaucii TaxID=2043161 RepID=A0A2N9LD02_9BACT|nr:Pectate lyase [Candidatus Sulfotelmatomonas gaucii]
MRLYSRNARFPLLAFAAALGLSPIASAKVIGMNVIAKPLTRERITTLPKKQQKAWLEYLERSEKQKAVDKQTLVDEQKAAGNTNPKHASSGRGMFALRAEHAPEWWTSDEAIKDAHNIMTYQVADGGWSKNIDMVSKPRAPGDLYDAENENRFPDTADFDKPVDPSWHYIATLDNDSTWTQIRFLARVTTALLDAHRDADAAPFRASAERGVEFLLNSQYPNGGWPQVWPLEGGYHDAITINDDAMLHAVEILRDVAEGAPDYKFLPPSLVKRAGPAAQRGIDCLLKLQIVENGVKTAWAQQYDPLTLEPTSARNYEMASLTSDESFPVVEFFMSLPDPTPAEVAAVHAACAWFTKVEILGYRYGSGNFMADRSSPDGRRLVAVAGAGPLWSRYYQIGTDKPIFGDRDKTIHDDVSELSRERRNGYSWFNSQGVAVLNEYKTWAQAHPR